MAGRKATDTSRRDRIIAAGREAFGRLPYDQVSVADVAEQAGVAHGLPFHYFKNKRGLYVEVVRSIAAELRIVQSVPAGLAPDKAMRRVLSQHMAYMKEHPYLLLGPMGSSVGLDPQVHAVFDEARWDGAVTMLTLFGVREPQPETRLLVQGWLAYMDAVLARWLVEPDADREHIVEAFIAVLLATLESARAFQPDLAPVLHGGETAEGTVPRRSA